jgi:predicted kinase
MSPSEIRLPADALVLLVGPSGCGKSTWARRHFRDTQIVSSDECRRLVSDDEADQDATLQAFRVLHAILRGRMSLGRLAIADATNLRVHARERLRGIAAEHGRPVIALVFDVSLDACLRRAAGRARQVSTEVIRSQHEMLQREKPRLEEEGYAVIFHLRERRSLTPGGEPATE